MKALFQDAEESLRKQMLQDNCDGAEDKGYMKPFSPEEITDMKDELSEVSITISEIEDEKRAMTAQFSEKLKPLNTHRGELLVRIKNKSKFVKETCYKFIDQEEGMVSFYNEQGHLVESRPIRPEERQKRLFNFKTGTNN